MHTFIGRPDNITQVGPLIKVRIGPPELYPRIGPLTVTALIDTGSDWTVLQEGIATALGLEPVKTTTFSTANKLDYPTRCYWVFVQFPEGKPFKVCVAEAPFMPRLAQCLIGRDILGKGILTYNGVDNTFTLSL